MKRVLSFGGGLQTTALAIMVAKGELEVDEVVFADTGAEKPETYWYMENYIKPMLAEIEIPFITVRSHLDSGSLYEHCWRQKIIPSVVDRWCTDKFKVRPIEKYYKGQNALLLVGFSVDESYRAERESRMNREFPLLDMGLSVNDCIMTIEQYGLPQPLRSSCYFCVFQHFPEWNWLKMKHRDLVNKALALELRHYERYPHLRTEYGLMKGTPLWRWGEGVQAEMLFTGERSCWSGHCGH